jgi:diguanylate cyclase (GGDEF)-like protein
VNLQQRVLALVLALLVLALGGTVAVVSRATYAHSLERARAELSQSRLILADRIRSQERVLREAAGALAKDDALRQALFEMSADPPSIRLALENHRRRTSADRAILVDLDGRVLVDTVDSRRDGTPFPFPELLAEPSPGSGDAAARPRLVELDGGVEEMVVEPYYVPVSAPRPSFWLVLGKRLGDDWARELRDLTGLEISLVRESAGDRGDSGAAGDRRVEVLTSSHGAPAREALARLAEPASDVASARRLAGEEYIALGVTFPGGIAAILDRPTAPTRIDTRKLVGRFAWIALGAALLAVAGAWLLARSVSRPIQTLEQAARRIASGEYSAELPVAEAGEVGVLAREFGEMQRAVREREAAIERLAFSDELTGLPNRNRFREELARRLPDVERAVERLAVALVDLDRFHEINDAFGHHVGDRLLLVIAGRLEELAKRRGLYLARLGGDEFAVLAVALSVGETRELVGEIERALVESIDVEEIRVDVAASVGVAIFPEHGGDPATLLRRAEVAMYTAKEGRLGSAFYEPTQDRDSIERLSLAGDLKRAIAGNSLDLVFQPKLEISSDRVHEVEVLLRWYHPRRGPVPAQKLVAVAERTGLIRELTAWVLGRSLEQGAAWSRDGLDLTLAVNISALDLLDAGLAARLGERLKRAGFPPQRLVLEITESSVMVDPAGARRQLDEVTAMGVRISVDDFGTGYSSLAQLKRLPVREIKVDRSFVIDMLHSPDTAQIVRSTIELGHSLGLRVVGEGVESSEALAALRALGCDLAQGHFVSAPLAGPELVRWLRERETRGSAA